MLREASAEDLEKLGLIVAAAAPDNDGNANQHAASLHSVTQE